MNKLVIKDLHASINGKPILNGITLELAPGTIHALMGPNGSGKSTLAHVIMGDPKYTIDKGTITLNGEDITALSPDKRARKGLFMSFQYPQEITGVTITSFLRTAYNATHKNHKDVVQFHAYLKDHMKRLHIDDSFRTRSLNVGFSGGEKKRAEILQFAVLHPAYAILDECDSGLDTEAIKIVGEGLQRLKTPHSAMLIITHYYRILNHVTPDKVSIIINGRIVDTGTKELAQHIEQHGFTAYTTEDNHARQN